MQPRANNLYYIIDPTFRSINRLFLLSLKAGEMIHEIILVSITCH